jgi:hypothetical protein
VEAGAEESLLRHYVPSLGILWDPQVAASCARMCIIPSNVIDGEASHPDARFHVNIHFFFATP